MMPGAWRPRCASWHRRHAVVVGAPESLDAASQLNEDFEDRREHAGQYGFRQVCELSRFAARPAPSEPPPPRRVARRFHRDLTTPKPLLITNILVVMQSDKLVDSH